MFVRSVFNSGERAGGAICGFWRASLPVITFPGVTLMREGPLSNYYRLSPGLSHHGGCLVGNNSTTASGKQLFIFTDEGMTKLVPRAVVGLVPRRLAAELPTTGGGFSSVLLTPHAREPSEAGMNEDGHFLPTNRKPVAQNNGQR